VIKSKTVSPQRYDSIVPYIDLDLPKSAIYKHNLIMLDIVKNNNWKRPIYFSGGSFDDENYLWMKDYLQLQGLVLKLVPVKTPLGKDDSTLDMGYIDTDSMYDIVMKWEWGNSGGNIYHDPQTRINGISYRTNLARLMNALILENKLDKARKVIDLAMKNMPVESFDFYTIAEPFASGYYQVGNKQAARDLLRQLIAKYRGSLTYYKSQSISDQNDSYRDIVGEIERYRSLLLVMQENGDTEFYNQSKPAFNTCNGWFKQFERENE